MRQILLLIIFLVSYHLQAQNPNIPYTNYEVVQVTRAYGFYYKLQTPIATATTTKKIYPIQVLLENRSAAPMENKVFCLHVLRDGKEEVLTVPKQNLPIGTTKTYTIVIEAEHPPVIIWGDLTN
jgi:hypothetical protein